MVMLLHILQIDLSLSKQVKNYLKRVSRVSSKLDLVPSSECTLTFKIILKSSTRE